ncbi:MAG: RluA family pseudouridine synthase [Lachnospiraceae bacterium]|nr:RluA family pseudouridine synthase [Lachnospiraceae bacterium]
MRSFQIATGDAGQRLDKYIKRLLPSAAGSFPYKMLRKKNIVVNGKKAEGDYLLQEGDEVRFYLAEETFLKLSQSETAGIEEYAHALAALKELRDAIVYEDEAVLILNKPAGVLSQKADRDDISVNEWLTGYLLEKGEATKESLSYFKPTATHRLDRNTSGLLVCAKTLSAEREMTRLFREDGIEKYYRLVVLGQVPVSGSIEGYLLKDEKTNTVTFSKEEVPGSKYSRTEYVRLSREVSTACCSNDYDTVSLVEARLLTGRSHQLRVHFASAGHPILFDPKYGNEERNRAAEKKLPKGMPKRQLLHCHKLVFPALTGSLSALSEREIVSREPEVFRVFTASEEEAQGE